MKNHTTLTSFAMKPEGSTNPFNQAAAFIRYRVESLGPKCDAQAWVIQKAFLPLVALLGLLLTVPAIGQSNYQWEIIAGSEGGAGDLDGTGTAARFNRPHGLAVDGNGVLYVADTFNNTIRRIASDGAVTTFAGTAGASGMSDGTGAKALFNNPRGAVLDGSGNLYVADAKNHTIRKITPAGVVATVAGKAGVAGSQDGTAGTARFNRPCGIALGSNGELYVADTDNHTIRKIASGGVVTTLAGSPGSAGNNDGTGSGAAFDSPLGIATGTDGYVYVADTNNNTIRKIGTDGSVTTLAGQSGVEGSDDGTGSAAQFSGPAGLVLDGSGNIYVADMYNPGIRKVTSGGVVTTLVASATSGYQSGIALDGNGNLYVTDRLTQTIRKITAGGVVTTVAGLADTYGNNNGTGSAATFDFLAGVAVDKDGTAYVTDVNNSEIRKITAGGVVTTIAGAAGNLGNIDGTGAAAGFSTLQGLAVDAAGNVYVAAEHVIRKITPGGVVTTLAGVSGSGEAGTPGSSDGTGPAAQFNYTNGVAVDGDGNVYVVDSSNFTIRKVTAGGVVTTLAGTPGVYGSDDGTGSAARFMAPRGIAVDKNGTLYVADWYNHTIRKITAAGVVTTLAGKAETPGYADGTGSAARFNYPYGVAVDGSGNVFVTEENNSTIRKIAPSGVVTTIGGRAGYPGNQPGVGSKARLDDPFGIAVHSDGTIYVVNTGSNSVMRGTPVADKPVQVLALTNPLAGQKITADQIVFSGIAAGHGAVSRIEVIVNGGTAQVITPSGTVGDFAWTLSVVPENGVNTVVVTAYDASNNVASTITRTFTFANLRPELANSYNGLLSATAQGTSTDHNGIISIMVTKTGAFTGKVSLSGVTLPISGVFKTDGAAVFGVDRTDSVELLKPALPSKISLGYLTLTLDTGSLHKITGALKNDDATITYGDIDHADQALYTSAKVAVAPMVNVPTTILDPTREKGHYTAIFRAKSDAGLTTNNGVAATEFPQGHGFGLITVSNAGVVKILGKLADGSAISFSRPLSLANEWPVYIPLYGGKGFVTGNVVFDSAQSDTDASCVDMKWFKAVGVTSSKIYPNGWAAGIATDFVASKFVPTGKVTATVPTPANPDTVLGVGVPGASDPTTANILISAAGGGLTTSTSNDASLSPVNKTTVLGATTGLIGATGLKTTFTASNGRLSGSFIHPTTSKVVNFSGVVFQKNNTASGFFLYLPPTTLPSAVAESGSVAVAKK